MKILLIHTYITSERHEFIQTMSEPMGLLCLATYLESQFKNEIDVGILDLYAMNSGKVSLRGDGRLSRGFSDEKEIIPRLRESKADIVGIHCNFTGYARDAYEVAAMVKKALPGAVVVMGGAHASYASVSILEKNASVHYIVRGEGEITFCELIKAIQAKRNPGEIEGVTYRDGNGRVIKTADRPLVRDIDHLPVPDRKFIDMKTYLALNRQTFPLAMKHPVASLMASRGCPYDCVFCSTKNMWSRRWRGRSPRLILREIEDLTAGFGVKEISFSDDQFLANPKWVHEICDGILEKRMNIALSLPSGASVWNADPPLLSKMKKAGFYRLQLPIESGNLRSLAFIRKPIKLDQVLKVIRCACRLGYWTSANFLIGFPYETKDEIMETVRFAYRCGIDYPFFFIAKPFAGAEMNEIFKKEGLIRGDEEVGSSVFVAKHNTLHLSAGELNRIRRDAERGFLKYKLLWSLNPSHFVDYILPRFLSWEGVGYFFKIVCAVILGKHRR